MFIIYNLYKISSTALKKNLYFVKRNGNWSWTSFTLRSAVAIKKKYFKNTFRNEGRNPNVLRRKSPLKTVLFIRRGVNVFDIFWISWTIRSCHYKALMQLYLSCRRRENLQQFNSVVRESQKTFTKHNISRFPREISAAVKVHLPALGQIWRNNLPHLQ